MCPNEIKGRLEAFTKGQKDIHEGRDTLAWMIGHYAAWAYHDPKKYPDKPHLITKGTHIPDEPMPEETMKAILTGFAETHNLIEREQNANNA